MERKLRQGGIPTAVQAAPPLEAWEGRQAKAKGGMSEEGCGSSVGSQGRNPRTQAHIKLASRAEE